MQKQVERAVYWLTEYRDEPIEELVHVLKEDYSWCDFTEEKRQAIAKWLNVK